MRQRTAIVHRKTTRSFWRNYVGLHETGRSAVINLIEFQIRSRLQVHCAIFMARQMTERKWKENKNITKRKVAAESTQIIRFIALSHKSYGGCCIFVVHVFMLSTQNYGKVCRKVEIKQQNEKLLFMRKINDSDPPVAAFGDEKINKSQCGDETRDLKIRKIYYSCERIFRRRSESFRHPQFRWISSEGAQVVGNSNDDAEVDDDGNRCFTSTNCDTKVFNSQ